jgi:anti-sigma regulatory factor (Ser/Thr protein kinase)
MRHEAGPEPQQITRTLWLRPAPEAAAVARGALAGLEHELEPGLFMDVSLCVSELLTSAVVAAQHSAEQTLELRLSLSGGVLAVSIKDHEAVADGGERRSAPVPDDDLGFHIISRLADRWGVDSTGAGRWLEFSGLGGDARERSPAFGADSGI